MKVSVIIPNYNHAVFLDQRLQSILNQTYTDFEIILLDDASGDNSREIIESYRSCPKVSAILYNEQNSGSVFKQWARGITAAQGELVWIAESDDWCEPQFLETLVRGMEAHPGCGLAIAQTFCVDESGKIRWQTHYPHLADCVPGADFVKTRMLRYNSVVNAGMAIFRKELFPRVSGEFQSFTYSGDWLFWIEIALMGEVFVTGRLLNFFRLHGNNTTAEAVRTGYHIQEHLRLLSILESRQVLDPVGYKRLIGALYKSYRKQRGRFSPRESARIRDAFFSLFPPGGFPLFLIGFNIYWVRKNFSIFRKSLFSRFPEK